MVDDQIKAAWQKRRGRSSKARAGEFFLFFFFFLDEKEDRVDACRAQGKDGIEVVRIMECLAEVRDNFLPR